jgi:hypothetical protein
VIAIRLAAAVDGGRRVRLGVDRVAAVCLLADSVPSRKMGVYMGIFNFFIVIPQLVPPVCSACC